MGLDGEQLVTQEHGGHTASGFGALACDVGDTTERCIKITVGLQGDGVILTPAAVTSIDLGGAHLCTGDLDQLLLYKLSDVVTVLLIDTRCSED